MQFMNRFTQAWSIREPRGGTPRGRGLPFEFVCLWPVSGLSESVLVAELPESEELRPSRHAGEALMLLTSRWMVTSPC